MNRLLKQIEDMMVAITFAEAGEYEFAKQIQDSEAVAEETTGEVIEVRETA